MDVFNIEVYQFSECSIASYYIRLIILFPFSHLSSSSKYVSERVPQKCGGHIWPKRAE